VPAILEQEWACTAEDILWRRTKLGLTLDDEAKAQLKAYVTQRMAARLAKSEVKRTPELAETSAA
jgi:glycerol-3-phosphate dehydrogenase